MWQVSIKVYCLLSFLLQIIVHICWLLDAVMRGLGCVEQEILPNDGFLFSISFPSVLPSFPVSLVHKLYEIFSDLCSWLKIQLHRCSCQATCMSVATAFIHIGQAAGVVGMFLAESCIGYGRVEVAEVPSAHPSFVVFSHHELMWWDLEEGR